MSCHVVHAHSIAEETTMEEPTHSQTVEPTETNPVSCIQPTTRDGTTVLVSSSSSIQPTNRDGAVTTTESVPVSSSTQTTNNPSSDGATTTSVIIVVAVVIILVVIVVGVVILVVLFRTKKRKQRLEINKLGNVTTEKNDVEMILKRDETTVIKNSDQPSYAKTLTELPPHIQSEELTENLNQNSALPGEYSEIELIQDDSKHALPSKPPRYVSLSDPISHKEESSTMYQSMNQHCDPSCTTHVPQETDIYTDPDTTSSNS